MRAFSDRHRLLNHGQVMRITPELAPPLLTTTQHQREDVCTFDKFKAHHCPTRHVFSGTRLEPMPRQPQIRCLDHWQLRLPVHSAKYELGKSQL
ncbi:uncharacterized protein TNCV_4763481 [Trichonephila clavipes]|nr:uncharacterized protein TNCV_4763481 [Trichonephila clavipes]